MFTATVPLALAAVDMLGELISTKSRNRFLSDINDSFSKLTRTVPIKRITMTSVEHAFVHQWVFSYRPPKTVLSDSGSKFIGFLLRATEDGTI